MDVQVERHGTQFRLVRVADELVAAVRKAGFTAGDGHWFKEFPAGTPHLDRAWSNFERLVEPMLRQTAGLEPVPWSSALEEVCRRLDPAGVDWWLTGSAALAVRGIPVSPGDLDLVVSEADSRRVGDLLLDGLVEPVAPADWFCSFWGRAMLGARVEWVGGVGPAADEPEPTDFGLVAAARLETVRWRDRSLRVPPLDLQRAVSVRRGLDDRVRLIDASQRHDPEDPRTRGALTTDVRGVG
jgi:hypothetical protein